jgi:heat shock protein HtpX
MSTNSIKTVLLLGLLSALFLLGGEMLLGGSQGLYVGLAFAVLMNLASYFFSDKIALAMYHAQPVSETENPDAWRRVGPLVQNLVQRMNLPMPKLYLIPDDSPNAFATGRNPSHSSVAFTHGILQLMNDQELEAVIGHELGHVKHRDILISSIAATLAADITMVARMAFWFGGGGRDDDNRGGALGGILMLILAPIAAMLIQMAISRSREYDADAAAAKYVGSPYPMIAALQKLETWSKRIPMDASPATAHMFIVKPFTGESMIRLFSTHPSTESRIERLQAIR